MGEPADSGEPAVGRRHQGQPSISFTGDISANELAKTLSDLARSLQDEDNVVDTLDGIVAAAVKTVPGAQYAGITEVRARRQLVTRAASHEVAREVDRAQYHTGQGPCVDAVYQQKTLRLSDMAQERRWPEFRHRVVRLGIRSMLAFQLYVVRDNLGALNLYSGETDAFSDESEHVGLLFASHAAVAMVGAQRQQDMDQAIVLRDMIGQAKGILMERHKITADQAFMLLTRASQRTNTKLTAIARCLTETGELSPSVQRSP